jgi:hypothetical protein
MSDRDKTSLCATGRQGNEIIFATTRPGSLYPVINNQPEMRPFSIIIIFSSLNPLPAASLRNAASLSPSRSKAAIPSGKM